MFDIHVQHFLCSLVFNTSAKFGHVKSSGYGQSSPARQVSSARERKEKDSDTLKGTNRKKSTTTRDTSPPKTNSMRKQQNETWSPAAITTQKIHGTCYCRLMKEF